MKAILLLIAAVAAIKPMAPGGKASVDMLDATR